MISYRCNVSKRSPMRSLCRCKKKANDCPFLFYSQHYSCLHVRVTFFLVPYSKVLSLLFLSNIQTGQTMRLCFSCKVRQWEGKVRLVCLAFEGFANNVTHKHTILLRNALISTSCSGKRKLLTHHKLLGRFCQKKKAKHSGTWGKCATLSISSYNSLKHVFQEPI